jgi:hypothetical protein
VPIEEEEEEEEEELTNMHSMNVKIRKEYLDSLRHHQHLKAKSI